MGCIQLSLPIVGSWNRCRRIGIISASIVPVVVTSPTIVLGSSLATIVSSFLLGSPSSPHIRFHPKLGVASIVVVVAPIIVVPVVATVVLLTAIGALGVQIALGDSKSGQSIGLLAKLSDH